MRSFSWFDGILQAGPAATELTSLVTIPFLHEPSESVRLDWAIHTGGFLRRKWEESIRSDRLVGPLCFEIGMKPDPVLVAEFNEWLGARTEINSFSTSRESREAWMRAVPSFKNMPWAELPPSEILTRESPWSEFIDSTLAQKFLQTIKYAGVDLEEPPWVLWSRFVPWVTRLSGPEALAQSWFELDSRLTFQRCALSPQDERGEQASLDSDFLMVNPTFETAEYPRHEKFRETPLVAFSRNFDEVHHRALTALEASVLDQVRESFRASRISTLVTVAGETGIRKEFVDSAVEVLIDDGYLLGASGRSSHERDQ